MQYSNTLKCSLIYLEILFIFQKINSNGISLAENSKNLEKSSQSNDPENAEETEMVIELHTEAAPVENYLEEEIQIKVPEVEEDTEKTPAGSPKSTSSCISSEILSEQSIGTCAKLYCFTNVT